MKEKTNPPESELASILDEARAQLAPSQYQHYIASLQHLALAYLQPYLSQNPAKQTAQIVGEAYSFFKSPTPIEEIVKSVPVVKDFFELPSSLEIKVIRYKDIQDAQLKRAGKMSSYEYVAGNEYAFHGRMPNATNRKVAHLISGLIGKIIDCDNDGIGIDIPEPTGWTFINAGGKWLEPTND